MVHEEADERFRVIWEAPKWASINSEGLSHGERENQIVKE